MEMTQIAYSLVLDFVRRTMGCFTCCFRIRDDHRRPQISQFSQPITAIHKEQVDPLSRNSAWPLLAPEEYSDEDRDLSQCEDGRYGVKGSPVLDDELRAEAQFLKSLGTLPQTPVEIRKTERLNDSQPQHGDTEPTSDSSIPDTATEEALQQQLAQLQSPIKFIQKLENGSDSSPVSSKRVENVDVISNNHSQGSAIGAAASTKGKKKSVHFENHSDSISSSSSSTNSSPRITKVTLKPSPYPTPLKLTDDMQTPGTVFSSYRKNQKIRVQYAYSGINPRNFSQLDEPIEEECIDQADTESPQSQVKFQESSTKKELNECPTLSSWLPPKSNCEEACVDQGLVDQTQTQTPGNRPILGVITLNAGECDTSFTPKWVDVNGIPNTTNKYSEDQKVKWHATPFEERLEKALMEDMFIPKMKQCGDTT